MLLPSESLVPFSAKRLANPKLVYVDPALADGSCDWLDRFAYLIPGDDSQADQFLNREKTFFAERYGGTRIVTHGGGVRCGMDADYSVKGIGSNPLLGVDAGERNSAYTGGTLKLAEAIQEVIWGAVLDAALPHGAVRVAALILTGMNCAKGADSSTPRALAVRAAVLRPAHFERAVYFRPHPRLALAGDVERVKQAILCLPNSLPVPSGLTAAEFACMDSVARLNLGLSEYADRCAAQAATALSKRFVHGAITASNISLDGRWLDFGTALAYQSHANTTPGKNVPALWEEYLSYLPIFQNLCFYIQKYFPAVDRQNLPGAERLTQVFLAVYQHWLSRAFISLVGFPESLLRSHFHRQPVQKLAAELMALARTGVEHPFISDAQDLERVSPNLLAKAASILACWYDHPDCERRLATSVADKYLRKNLIESYRKVMQLAGDEAKAQGIPAQGLKRLIYLRASKLGRNISAIDAASTYSRHLRDDFPPGDKLQSYFDQIDHRAEILYRETDSLDCLMWRNNTSSIVFDARDNQFKYCIDGKVSYLLWTELENSKILQPMRDFWGDSLWHKYTEREKSDPGVQTMGVCCV